MIFKVSTKTKIFATTFLLMSWFSLATANEIKVYRIAIATTGEVGQLVGSVAMTSEAIDVWLGQVNEIFIRDLGIKFELIPQNDTLIHTNPSTDPFTEGANKFVLVKEAHDFITSTIGPANFDIGHTLGYGATEIGGGVGFQGVCDQNLKAMGITGILPYPYPGFHKLPLEWSDVSLLAHEIAHQFGADHTFAGALGDCAFEFSPNSAVEPGAGSTIMSYGINGSCDDDEFVAIGKQSPQYFHAKSIEQIGNYSAAMGACYTLQANSNEAPQVFSFSKITIPSETPFILKGNGVDRDGDLVKHNWETVDIVSQSELNVPDNGEVPLFRSIPPTYSPYRYLPSATTIPDSRSPLGERLPSQSRVMKWRYSAWDSRGGYANEEQIIEVDDTAGPFIVHSPVAGSIQTDSISVTWEVAGTSAYIEGAQFVDIYLSLDNGKTFQFDAPLAIRVANDGEHVVALPQLNSKYARVMVKASDNVFYAVSPGSFILNDVGDAQCGPGEIVDVFREDWDDGNTDGWTSRIANGYHSWEISSRNPDGGPHHIKASIAQNQVFPGIPENILDNRFELDAAVRIPRNGIFQVRHAKAGLSPYYDAGLIEWSVDGSNHWQSIEGSFPAMLGEYNARAEVGYSELVTDEWSLKSTVPAFSGSNTDAVTYETSRYDLSAAEGQLLKFRFRIGSTGRFVGIGEAGYGWDIDTISLFSCIKPPSIHIAGGSDLLNSTGFDVALAANGTDVSQWKVNVGTTAGADNLFSGPTLSVSEALFSVPEINSTTGDAVYIELSYFNITTGEWKSVVSSYEVRDLSLVADVTPPKIDRGILLDELAFSVELTTPLPDGFGVFLNFDNQRGGWYNQIQEGGHYPLSQVSGGTYSARYIFNRAGLRSVRAGIFLLGETRDQDVLVGSYSEGVLCTEVVCLDAITVNSGIGDPIVARSGSELVHNVDVASGNYHISSVDLQVKAKGISFEFPRAYNSQSSTPWSFGYEARARYVPGKFERELSIGPKEDGRYQYYFKEMEYLGGEWFALNPGNFDQLVENADGSFTQYTRGNKVYQFSAPVEANTESTGQLTRIEDRFGNGLSFSHRDGKLNAMQDENGRSYIIGENSDGKITSVRDDSNRVVYYRYNAAGQLDRFTNARGFHTNYSYNENGLLETITDALQNESINLTYNTSSQVSSLLNAEGEVTNYIYDRRDIIGGEGTGVSRATIDGIDHSKVYLLDEARRCVIGVVDAENAGNYKSTIARARAPNRNDIAKTCLVEKRIRPANLSSGLATRYAYTADGRTRKIESELNNDNSQTTFITYSAELSSNPNLRPVVETSKSGIDEPTTNSDFTVSGKPGRITDSRGNTTVRTYDSNGWVNSVVDPLNRVTSYTYTPEGLLQTITDAMGGLTSYEYDAVGRKIKEISPLGLVTTYEYNKNNHLTRKNESAPGGIDYTTFYSYYDEEDNLKQMIDPLGLSINYSYDSMNRRIGEQSSVLGQSFTKQYEYDALGRLFKVTDARGNASRTSFSARDLETMLRDGLGETIAETTYDDNGNQSTVKDGVGRTVSYQYDALDRKISASYDDGNAEYWQYDGAGRVSVYTDKLDQDTSYLYDSEGNLIKTIDASGGVTSAVYDAVGNVLEITDAENNTTKHTYDALNRRTSTTLPDGSGSWQYVYDANGNLLTKTTPTGETVEQQFDALNRLVNRIERASDGVIIREIEYSYDANSNVVSERSGGKNISYQYDRMNRLLSVTDSNNQRLSYGYDLAGNRTIITYPGNLQVLYQYDAANRMVSVEDWLGNVTSYLRNEAGQITQASNANNTITHYSYDSLGRLLQLTHRNNIGGTISQHSMSYDNNGNVIGTNADTPSSPTFSTGQSSFDYDENNFIVQSGDSSFDVDSAGRLIAEQNSTGQHTTYRFNVNDLLTEIELDGQTHTIFDYDSRNNRISVSQNGIEKRYLIDQLSDLPNVLVEYDANGRATSRYVYGDGLVSRIDSNNSVSFYHYDQTGHTVALTNNNGEITDHYAYTPYGQTTSLGTTDNPFKYAGKFGVMDDGNGLLYMRARYYRSDMARFLSLDSVEGSVSEPTILNRLAYGQGDPIGFVDPSGRSVKGGLIKITLGAVAVTMAVVSAPVILTGASAVSVTFAIVSIVGGTLGGVGSVAGGVVELAATAVIRDQQTLERVEETIGYGVTVADPYYSVGYVVSGANNGVATNFYRAGQVVTYVSSWSGMMNNASNNVRVYGELVGAKNSAVSGAMTFGGPQGVNGLVCSKQGPVQQGSKNACH